MPLIYRGTVFGGRILRERWESFACGNCGPLEYRHRTGVFSRTLKK